jgi:hypothetical protein
MIKMTEITEENLRWKLIEAGHNAIFAWVALYVASGIGLIQMIIEILKINVLFSFSLAVFGVIYSALVCLMTLSLCSILKIMHQQNDWANKLFSKDKTLRNIYFESRSRISKYIIGENASMRIREKIGLMAHLLGFLGFGFGIWYLNIFFHWLLHIRGF